MKSVHRTWMGLVCCLVVLASTAPAFGGACCLDPGVCQELSSADCAVFGGVYQGDGTGCDTARCTPYSVDVNDDGFVDTGDFIAVLLGWGACPDPCPSYCMADIDGDCLVDTDDLIEVLVNWGMPIQVTGACCFDDGTCGIFEQVDCINAGGTYQGDDLPCLATSCAAACCLADGSCQFLDVTSCGAIGGTYLQFGSGCASDGSCIECGDGACCLPDSTCTVLNRNGCDQAGGTYLGTGTACTATYCEVQVLDFSCPLSPCSVTLPFNQFDTLSGGRDLVQVIMASYNEIGADATIENTSELPNLFSQMITQGQVDLSFDALGILLSYAEFVPAPELAPADANPGTGFDFFNFGHPTFCGADADSATDPPDDLTPYIGNGLINALVEAVGQVGVTSTTDVDFQFFNFVTEGDVTIAYLYEIVGGACCDPCDGTCTPNLAELACIAAGGLWQGPGVPCTPVLCPIIGACCDPCDGTCVPNLTEAQCLQQGGLWQGACVECTPGLCPIIGACCDPCDGTCTPDLTEAQCLTLGGLWQGACSVCTPGLCPIIGACCDPCDGTCVPNLTEAQCLALGGLWQGVCVECTPGLCPIIGACCDPCDGTCVPNLTEAQCLQQGGLWQGACSACTPGLCPIIGACCDPCDGTCIPNLTEAQCLLQGGLWQGACVECTPGLCPIVGACCDPCDGTCIPNLTEAQCLLQGGLWQGACSACTPGLCPIIGACCDPCDGTCTPNLTEAQCSAQGGYWQGVCTTCDPGLCPIVGACCDPCDGTCIPNLTEAQCLLQGGLWQGACVECTPGLCPIVGACCDPCDGTCIPNLTEAQCLLQGGLWQGACAECTPGLCPIVGACCDPCDGTCTPDLTEAQCVAQGGLWQGPCVECTPGLCPIVGACCDPCDGTCTPNLTEIQCLQQGGLWQGACTECTPGLCPMVGACCLEFGDCIETTPALCLAQGGLYQGDCTDCDDVDCDPCPYTLDFETEDDFQTILVNGQDISTPPEFGNFVAISSEGTQHCGPAIFDTKIGGPNDPNGRWDEDLLVDKGNVLILQSKDNCSSTNGIFDFPNDEADGGTLVFDFIEPSELFSIVLVDIDCCGQETCVKMYDCFGRRRSYFVPNNWTNDINADGPNGYDTLDLTTLASQPGEGGGVATASEDAGFDPLHVVRLKVTFGSSGALDDLVFCPTGPCDVPPVGACCDPCDGTCTPDLTEVECLNQGGIWQGLGSDCYHGACPVMGACCLGLDLCIETTRDDCAAQGGQYQGDCTECAWINCDECPYTLDFETEDDFQTVLGNGQCISSPPEFGVYVDISSLETWKHLGPAIFDSTVGGPNDPNGRWDEDLLVNKGNLLILQSEDNPAKTGDFFDFPNDAATGGILVFDFIETVELFSIVLVDVDCCGQDAWVKLYDCCGRKRVYDVPDNWTYDPTNAPNGYDTLDLTTLNPQVGEGGGVATAWQESGFDPTRVVRLKVIFDGSNAVDDIVFCPGGPCHYTNCN